MKKFIPQFFKLLSLISPKLAAQWALKIFSKPKRSPREDDEIEFLFTGKQVTFQSMRRARTWGQGTVIWLLHGWESRGSTFHKMIPMLVDKGYQVVAWDGPAHGDSPGNTTHVVDYAAALSKDINESIFDDPIAILGHSFGGAALAVLSKIHTMPAKVVIISSPTRVTDVFSRYYQMIKLSDKAIQYFVSLSETSSGYSLHDISLISNDISKTSDTLIIHDKDDEVIPFADFEILQETWQSGKYVVTENLGHNMTIKDPEVLTEIVDFIDNPTDNIKFN